MLILNIIYRFIFIFCDDNRVYYFNKNKVIYKGVEIQLLPNEAEFEKLKYGYLKSNMRVFYKGQPIPGANQKSFTVINRSVQDNKTNSVLGSDYDLHFNKRFYFKGKILL